MGIQLVRYYLIKEASRFVSPSITSTIKLDNQSFFRYALFFDASDYYKLLNPFKTDRYGISTLIKGPKFADFLKECMENAYYHSSSEEKFFCYTLFMSYVINNNYQPFIEAFTPKKKKSVYVEKMLNSYYFNSNENMPITKMNLADYFFDSFALSESDINLIDKPLKRVFGFFCAKNYYDECYKNAKFYFNHFTKDFLGIKKITFNLYDFFLNHRKNKLKARHFLYHKKIDTTVLNLKKEVYNNGVSDVNHSVDELYNRTLKDLKVACDVLNNYFNFNQDLKAFDKYFNIPKNKERSNS